jgi:hypothetical protein
MPAGTAAYCRERLIWLMQFETLIQTLLQESWLMQFEKIVQI